MDVRDNSNAEGAELPTTDKRVRSEQGVFHFKGHACNYTIRGRTPNMAVPHKTTGL
jgi:hypothetical protein